MPPAVQLFLLADRECTDWAAYKRPDIYYNQTANDSTNWDAWTWAEHAQAEGLTVNSTPQAGDIAVWPISAGSAVGHVAYVESVSQNAIMVSEMNAPGDLVALETPDGHPYSEKTWPLTELAQAGVQYIHQR